MNSLRKIILALSLLAAVPATEAAWYCPEWLTNFASAAKEAVVSRTPERVSKFATDSVDTVKARPKTSAAIGLGTVAVLGGAGYLAKKYPEKAKAVVNAPKDLVKSAYAKFANLPRTKKAAVVVGGTVLAVGASYLLYKYLTRDNPVTQN